MKDLDKMVELLTASLDATQYRMDLLCQPSYIHELIPVCNCLDIHSPEFLRQT